VKEAVTMKRGRIAFAAALVVFVAAGCGVDVVKQLQSNEQMRGQVMDAIVANKDLTAQLLTKLVARDSTRIGFVDGMLHDPEVAKQIIVRVGTNPDALDMVLGVAAQDSAMRVHLMTLVKGMEMGAKKAK
jgi:hypothetical protein